MKRPTMVKWAALLLFLLAAPMAALSQSREGSVEVSGGSLVYLELAARLPRASLLILPGGSHGFIMEGGLASQLVAVALSEFLGDQTPDPSPHPTPP